MDRPFGNVTDFRIPLNKAMDEISVLRQEVSELKEKLEEVTNDLKRNVVPELNGSLTRLQYLMLRLAD